MTNNRKKVSRRDFFKKAGVLGIGTAAGQILGKSGLLETDALPAQIRSRIEHVDFSKAEKRCPQRMAIGKLMQQALRELA